MEEIAATAANETQAEDAGDKQESNDIHEDTLATGTSYAFKGSRHDKEKREQVDEERARSPKSRAVRDLCGEAGDGGRCDERSRSYKRKRRQRHGSRSRTRSRSRSRSKERHHKRHRKHRSRSRSPLRADLERSKHRKKHKRRSKSKSPSS